jgi:hypothetical protein
MSKHPTQIRHFFSSTVTRSALFSSLCGLVPLVRKRRVCVHSQVEALSMGFLAMQFNLVVSTNERAVRLWKKLGFTVIGTLPQAFRHQRLGLVDALVTFKELAR